MKSVYDAPVKRRWHSVKLEKICDEPRHFAWDSGIYMGLGWRIVIGPTWFSVNIGKPGRHRLAFGLGRIRYGRR